MYLLETACFLKIGERSVGGGWVGLRAIKCAGVVCYFLLLFLLLIL